MHANGVVKPRNPLSNLTIWGFPKNKKIHFFKDFSKKLNNLKFYTQEYRSGHNEAVLKTVWGKPHGGSNPSSCANENILTVMKSAPKIRRAFQRLFFNFCFLRICLANLIVNFLGKLRVTVVIIKPVLFLLYIVQLRIAKTRNVCGI